MTHCFPLIFNKQYALNYQYYNDNMIVNTLINKKI